MKNVFLTLGLIATIILSSCERNDTTPTITTNDGMVINNNLSSLSNRLIKVSSNIDFKSQSETKSSQPTFVIEEVAQLLPPTYNNETLQASHIRIVNGYAFISYNTQGPRYLGGVDVVNVTDPNEPVLISEVVFINEETNEGKDVSSLDVEAKGSGNNNFVWIVGASEDVSDELETPAFAGRFPLNESNQFKHIDELDKKIVDLPGYVGTDVKFSDEKGSPKVYFTSGTGGGLTILNNGMNTSEFFTLENARSVDVNKDYVLSLAGNPGRLFIPNGLDQTIGGATDPEAKSMVRLSDNFALVALGEEGLKCFNLSSATPSVATSSLPRPIIPEVSPDPTKPVNPWEYVTNGVSISDNVVYIANGAAGLDVALLENGQLNLLGNINLGASANFVGSDDNYIFVATGLGGLKILKVSQK